MDARLKMSGVLVVVAVALLVVVVYSGSHTCFAKYSSL
jgi:hypothetical protein